jgi:hypothetical protein
MPFMELETFCARPAHASTVSSTIALKVVALTLLGNAITLLNIDVSTAKRAMQH